MFGSFNLIKMVGGGCLKGFFVSGNQIQTSTTSELLIELNTEDANFSNVASRFYIIANGGESLFTTEEIETGSSIEGGGTTGTLTEATLKSKTVDFTFSMEENKLQTTQPTLPTSGPIEYTPEENKIVVVSRMFRAFSKHSITVNYTGKTGVFTPTSVTVNNIPKAMALFEAGGTDNTYYPSTEKIGEEGSLFDTSNRNYSFSWNSTSKTTNAMVFFMPENLRGAGTATGQKEKGVEGKGPGLNGSLTGCTFLTIEGKYKYESGQFGEVGVKYRFYLGGNFTDDYNIYRDYHYNMTVNISGANSADLRVTITNGNVAVFDKVEEISNTVEF